MCAPCVILYNLVMAEDNKFGGGPWTPPGGGQSGGSQNLPPRPINNSPASGSSSLPTGEGELPLSKPSDIKFDLRTMSSDIASMKESGGGAPRPYVPPPPVRSREESPVVGSGQMRPGAPPSGIAFAPEKMASVPTPPFQPKPAPLGQKTAAPMKKKSSGLFYGLLVVVVVAGLAALGYFFIYPAFFGEKAATEPEAGAPATTLLPEAPLVETPPPVVEAPPPPQTPATHVSLFKTPADETISANVPNAPDPTFLRNVIQNETSGTPKLKEFVLTSSVGGAFQTGELFFVLFSRLETGLFENDPTVFVYTAQSGSYPGLALRAKLGVNLEDAKTTAASQIESSPEITNIFLSNPPASSGAWKSGTADGVATRYVVLGSGFAFNYGWVGNVLVMSASYDGVKEAAKKLQ